MMARGMVDEVQSHRFQRRVTLARAKRASSTPIDMYSGREKDFLESLGTGRLIH